jgi:hypothetical protein
MIKGVKSATTSDDEDGSNDDDDSDFSEDEDLEEVVSGDATRENLTDISKRKVGFFSHLQSEDKISSEVINPKNMCFLYLS